MARPNKLKNIQNGLAMNFLRDSVSLSAVACAEGAEGWVGEIGKKKRRTEEKERAPSSSSFSFFFPDFPNPFMRLLRRLVRSLLLAKLSVVTRFALDNPQTFGFESSEAAVHVWM